MNQMSPKPLEHYPQTRDGMRGHILQSHGRSSVNRKLRLDDLDAAHRHMHEQEQSNHKH